MKNYRASGFTLIELMIVIIIMGLLAGIVAPQMFGKVDGSKRKIAQTQMMTFDTAIQTYRLDVGNLPQNLNQLRNDTARGWDGPYLQRSIPLDPWNNSYVYRVPGEEGNDYYMASLGKDGREGGDGDNEDIVLQW